MIAIAANATATPEYSTACQGVKKLSTAPVSCARPSSISPITAQVPMVAAIASSRVVEIARRDT
jgi:hypothetical protein